MHDEYMKDFERIYQGLDRHGPGTDQHTLWALEQVQPKPERILDIGCGTGASSLLLAENTSAEVVGLDNSASSLDTLQSRAKARGVDSRLTACNASMTSIPFEADEFDLLWSEGSAYIMGFEEALKQWRPLLKPAGHLVVSDLVWLDDYVGLTEGEGSPEEAEIKAFWQQEYPGMEPAAARLQQCQKAGYDVVAHRMLGREAWQLYVDPLKQRIAQLEPEMPDSQAIKDLKREFAIVDQLEGRFDYMMMVLKKR